MATRSARTKRVAAPLRYTEDDLAPHSGAEDAEFVSRFIKRNRAALNAALKEARASIKRGEGVEVKTYEQFAAALQAIVQATASAKNRASLCGGTALHLIASSGWRPSGP